MNSVSKLLIPSTEIVELLFLLILEISWLANDFSTALLMKVRFETVR